MPSKGNKRRLSVRNPADEDVRKSLGVNDELEDRENRRKNRRKSILMAEQGPPSPAVTPYRPRPMDANRMSDLVNLYKSTLQAAAANKISQKNTWSLDLPGQLREFDHIQGKLAGESDSPSPSPAGKARKGSSRRKERIFNFPTACATLDASMQVYKTRVDDTHGDAFKTLASLSTVQQDDDCGKGRKSNDDDEGDETSAAAKKRRMRNNVLRDASHTLESNPSNLLSKQDDFSFSVDPSFQRTAAAFDEGGARGLLLNQLGCETGGHLSFEGKLDLEEPEEPSDVMIDVALLRNWEDMRPSKVLSAHICPKTRNFRFTGWSVEAELEEMKKINEPSSSINMALNINQEVNFEDVPVDEPEIHADAIQRFEEMEEEMGGIDDMMDTHDDFDDDDAESMGVQRGTTRSEVHVTEEALVNKILAGEGEFEFDFGAVLAEDTSSNPYSFFDKKQMLNWAGPKHWKFQPIRRDGARAAAVNGSDAKRKKQKKKDFFIDFFSPDETNYEKAFLPPQRGGTTLSNAKKGTITTLPPDTRFDPRRLRRLFNMPSSLVRRRKVPVAVNRSDSSVTDVAQEMMAEMDIDGDNDIGGDEFEMDGFHASQPETEALTFGSPSGDYDDTDDEDESIMLEDQVTYSKHQKKVDVKNLKRLMWMGLRTESTDAEDDDENVKPSGNDAQHDSAPVVLDDIPSDSIKSFSRVIREIPQQLPKKQAKDVSVPFCFICLLHLANEKGLRIEKTSEGFESGDLSIRKAEVEA